MVIVRLVILCIFPLTSFISALQSEVVAKLVRLGISPSTWFISALAVVVVVVVVVVGAKLVISGILSSIFFLS